MVAHSAVTFVAWWWDVLKVGNLIWAGWRMTISDIKYLYFHKMGYLSITMASVFDFLPIASELKELYIKKKTAYLNQRSEGEKYFDLAAYL